MAVAIELGDKFALTPDVSLAISNVLLCKRQVLQEHRAAHPTLYHVPPASIGW